MLRVSAPDLMAYNYNSATGPMAGERVPPRRGR
jgi:hypothetical protein